MSTPEQTVYKCAPCGFSATLKTNYERHCLGAKHLVKCSACSQTNTIDFYFKRIEVRVAEVAAVVQLNTAAIAEVRVELKQDIAEVKAAVVQLTATFEVRLELQQLKAENAALLVQLAHEREINALKLASMTTQLAPKTRQVSGEPTKKSEKQVAKEAAKKTVAVEAKAVRKAESAEQKEAADVASVEEEEARDVETLRACPAALMQYLGSEERLCASTYPVNAEHRANMDSAFMSACEDLGSGVNERAPEKTLRGSRKLKHRSEFHPELAGPKRAKVTPVVDEREVQRVLARDMLDETRMFNEVQSGPKGDVRDWLRSSVRLCRTKRAVTAEHSGWFNGLLSEYKCA